MLRPICFVHTNSQVFASIVLEVVVTGEVVMEVKMVKAIVYNNHT